MRLHRIEDAQLVAAPLERVWTFFANPHNLARLTPPELGFEMRGDAPDAVYPGLLLHYTVRPLWGLPLRWVGEITHVAPHEYFVDEQRAGPYALWHHEHHFRPAGEGTEVRDVVHYALPFDPLSRPLHDALVAPRLRAMFAHRKAALRSLLEAPG